MVKDLLNKTWVIGLLIVGLTCVIYSQTISYGMLHNFDDDAYFSDNRINELNASNVKTYFSDYYLGMYQPLPVLSFALVDQAFPGSVEAQRIINLVLHCINILLVLLIINKVTRNNYVGAFTALIFAVHPMHVESVTWISTRSNLMYSAFYLGSVLAFVNLNNRQSLLKWALVVCLFTLALFSKVTAATMPVLLLLIGWYTGAKFSRTAIGMYVILFTISGIFILVGINASSAFGHITEMGQTYSLAERVVVFLHALWLYLAKFLFPVNQSVIYLFPFRVNGAIPLSYYITAILALVATGSVFFAGLRLRKSETGKAILFGFMFFIITISIVMPLKWSRTIIIAERYTYLPYIGLAAGLLIILYSIANRSGGKFRYILTVSLIFTGLLLAGLSYQRNKVWENPITLFTDVIIKNRGTAEISMGYYNRGNEYFRLKNAEVAVADYSSAINYFPEYADAYYNRGLTYYLLGDNKAAIIDFTSTIRINSGYVNAYINRSAAYRNTGKYAEALTDLNRAIEIRPVALAYLSRGILYYANFNNPTHACNDWNVAAQMGSDRARELLQQNCTGQ